MIIAYFFLPQARYEIVRINDVTITTDVCHEIMRTSQLSLNYRLYR